MAGDPADISLHTIVKRQRSIVIHLFIQLISHRGEHKQESRAVAMKPRDAAAVRFNRFGLKFADDINCKFKSK